MLFQNNKLNFVFIRHGETPWNVENRAQGSSNDPVFNGLTPKGRDDVKYSANFLKNYFDYCEIDPSSVYIYTTPMHRTYDTSRIVSDTLGLPQGNLIIHPGLSGRYYGGIEGLKDVKNPKTIMKKPGLGISYVLSELGIKHNGQGIETRNNFKERACEALNDVINDAVENQVQVAILCCNSDIWDFIRKEPAFETVFDFEFKNAINPGEFMVFDLKQRVFKRLQELKQENNQACESIK